MAREDAGSGDVAGPLRAMLAGVLNNLKAGRMEAPPLTRARIEGALVALDVLAGSSPEEIVDRLTADA